MLNKKIHDPQTLLRYFGTDGIRGKVGIWPMTPEFFLKLGWAAGMVLTGKKNNRMLLGKDTRLSCYLFESALQAGLSAAGVQVYLTGPLPTPAISYLTHALDMQAGIVITASHNPRDDNGIKFFSADGYKIPSEFEAAIETKLQQPIIPIYSSLLGKTVRVHDAMKSYLSFCKSTLPFALDLKKMNIVVDCANGAVYKAAPLLLRELNAHVIEIGTQPDGMNINVNCGALQVETVRNAVLQHRADLGLAFDGDGDRLVMVDHRGHVLDGDELLYIIVKDQLAHDSFSGGVVGTVMTNFGLEECLRKAHIPFIRTPVGDKYIMDELLARGWHVGGEPAGHIVCHPALTTGDGLITALHILSAMKHQQKSLAEITNGYKKYPQVLVNVNVQNHNEPNEIAEIREQIRQAKRLLGANGRIIIRKSGTEPVVRVMVEGQDSLFVHQLSLKIANVVKKKLG